MSARPPERALRWVAARHGAGSRVVSVRRLSGASAAAVHSIDVIDGAERRFARVLRRYVRPEVIEEEPDLVDREANALAFLERHGIRAPRLVATDPEGDYCDVPSILITRLAGRVDLAPSDPPRWARDLACALLPIHSLTPAAHALGAYEPWNLGHALAPPPWATNRRAWERAFDAFAAGPPNNPARLVHRDYHPGNVLWLRHRVNAIVDWVNACIGPPAADLAHCRLNLAVLAGLDIADAFLATYEAEMGPIDDITWFDLASVCGVLPGAMNLWAFHDAGRTDLTTPAIAARLDQLLVRAVAELG